MPLATRLEHVFSSAVRQKGESYARNRVSLIPSKRSQPHVIEAKVNGSYGSKYHVSVRWEPRTGALAGQCTCPYFEEGNFCKHLWATILSADHQGLTPNLPGNGRLELAYVDPDGEKYEEAYYDEYIEDFDEELDPPRPANIRKTTVTQAAPSWEAELHAIGKLPEPPKLDDLLAGRQHRVFYIVDMVRSADSGELAVELFEQATLKSGEWGKLKSLTANRHSLDHFGPEDVEVLGLVLGNRLNSGGGYYGHTSYDSMFCSEVRISEAMTALLLPKMAATGRLGWEMGHPQGGEATQSLVWDDGPRWQPRIRIDANDKKKQWTLAGELTRTTAAGEFEVLPLPAPVLVLASGVVMQQDRVGLVDASCDFRWVTLLRKHESLVVPYAERTKLMAAISQSTQPIDVQWPAGHEPIITPVRPVGHLRVHPAPDSSEVPTWQRRGLNDLFADAHFKYGDAMIPIDSISLRVWDTEGEQLIERDREAEAELLNQLRGLKLSKRDHHGYQDTRRGSLQLAASRLPIVVSELVARGWEVEAEGHRVRSASAFRTNVSSGVDWFDLDTQIDFGDTQASLPALLAAIKAGENFVTLGDGSRGMLPQEWLARYAPLAEIGKVAGDRLRFKLSQAMLLDAMLVAREGDAAIELDRRFATFRNRLRNFEGIAPAKAPRGFRGELRPYQQQGLGWLKFLQSLSLGGCLADDMGLGKTVQVLALLLGRRQRRAKGEQHRPSLVVAPKSLVFNWQAEAERFTPTLSVLNHTGLTRDAEQLGDFDLVLTTYGTLRRDIEQLSKQPFDYVILDEAQAIKNHTSLSAKACRLLDARHRLTLTGTPIENRLDELWSQFEFLNPGMLGRSTTLTNLTKQASSSETNEQQQALASLRKGLAPFMLRRTKKQVLKDLPEKSEQTLYCELLPKDRKKYDELRTYYRDSLLQRIDQSGMDKSRMHVLEALLRLRQAACHPGLIDGKLASRPSAKVDLLVEQLSEVVSEGHKALVFSQFTSLLAIVRDRLDTAGIRYEYLDGRTRKRQDRVERFQNDDTCSAFLISLKAGGTGLNLTAADYVFLLDPWWNPAAESQAIDRAHRIGQTRSVFAYRLIAQDTVEEKVLKLQERKRHLVDAILEGNSASLAELTIEDLQLLLS